jgi:hypothetical protein
MKSLVVAALLAATSIAHAQPNGGRAPAPPAWTFDKTGWTYLGSAVVDGKKDRDVITVGKYEGKFDELTVVVVDSDLQLEDFTVVFGNGDKFSPKLKHTFKEGQRSKSIDLPGNDRQIQKIELLYKNTAGGGKAKLEVYGRNKQAKTPGQVFDGKGWTMLGTRSVDGKKDRDTIDVAKYTGKFDTMTVVVLNSDIDLNDLTITFGNGDKWSPKLKHSFKEGTRSKAFDLPGDDRVISKIDLLYTNKAGGGKATVEVWAKDSGRKPPVGGNPPPSGGAFDKTGWTFLGDRTVDGRRDKDSIKVGKYEGRFDQVTMVVSDSDLELKDLTFVFGGGEKWSPHVAHFFKEGARSRAIDLPGNNRVISRIDLNYANLPGGGKARVELYGRDLKRPAPPPIVPVTWENKGWTFLGKSTVDGWRDRDHINVLIGGPYTEVMFVVAGSDVELSNIVITLGNKEKFEMKDKVVFKEGTRTSPIDIPGKLRKIKSIDFAYANLPGGGRASVEVWARKKGTGADPGSTPPNPPVVRDHK